jgi:RHS repeat-associated protein
MPVTNFFWDDQNLLQESDDYGQTTCRFTATPSLYGTVLGQLRNGDWRGLLHDGLSSISALVSNSEAVTDAWEYNAWGIVVNRTGSTPCNLQFSGLAGYYRDEVISRYYVRRRHYAPILARWKSGDPMMSTSNLFLYLQNSPANGSDPSGMIDIMTTHTFRCICGVLGPRGSAVVRCPGDIASTQFCFDKVVEQLPGMCVIACLSARQVASFLQELMLRTNLTMQLETWSLCFQLVYCCPLCFASLG